MQGSPEFYLLSKIVVDFQGLWLLTEIYISQTEEVVEGCVCMGASGEGTEAETSDINKCQSEK